MTREVSLLPTVLVCFVAGVALAFAAPAGAVGAADGSPAQPGVGGSADLSVLDAGGASETTQRPASPVARQFGTGTDETNESDGDEDPVVAGVETGAAIASDQGVSATEAEIDAAVERAEEAAAGHSNVSDEAREAAATGAAHGALLQRQRANVTQLQAAVGGAIDGALAESDTANATQIQAATYGAAHGSVAHDRRANATAIAAAARGGAGGATVGATASENATVAQIHEGAQGGAYGALEQRQTATVSQIQAAAFGAGEGVANASQADPKQVQAAALGASKGSLVQGQNASVEQLQAVTAGATEGALDQHQNATVVQLQQVAAGAAEGALRQAGTATARQLRAAAMGAAGGTIVQVQQVTVVQIQQAAAGAASGAAGAAGQRQVTDVRQIQAAAFGAGQGAVVQVQQDNVVQIQVVAEGAARGALSQHQRASVTQIQSAARGASEGTIDFTQRQRVTVQQSQQHSERAAASTLRTVIGVDVRVDVVVYQYARGTATDPADDDATLRSLLVATEDDTVFMANPNDVSVSVTITSDTGDLQTVTLAPGESVTRILDPGLYTVTAETAAGESVDLAGRAELRISIGEDLASVSATAEDGRLFVENPNDEHVALTVRRAGAHVLTFHVPPNGDRTWDLEPGTYRLTAESLSGESVPVNDADSDTIDIESREVGLALSVDDQNVSIENPSDVDVTVTATNETDGERELSVPADSTVTGEFAPGNYTFEGETADDRRVFFDGNETAAVEIEGDDDEEPPGVIDLAVSVDGRNVTIDNPNETAVTVTAAPDEGANVTLDVSAEDTATDTLDPGNYTLTGEADDDRNVTLNGEASLPVNITAPVQPPVDLNVSVSAQNVTLDNPNATAVTVTAVSADGQNVTVDVPAEANVTELFDPGNYTLTGEADDGRNVTLNGETSLDVNVSAPSTDFDIAECRAITEPGDYQVTADLAPEAGETCIEIQSANVTIDGNGHAIDGSDVADGTESTGVTTAIDGAGDGMEDQSETVVISDLRAVGWERGIDLEADAQVENVSVEANTEFGIWAAGFSDVTIVNATAAENGVGIRAADATVGLDSSTVRNNDEAGVAGSDSQVTITNTTVADNGDGITHYLAELTLTNVTVTDNEGWELGPATPPDGAPGSMITATDLFVGEAATLSFDISSALALETVDQAGFPDLPADASAVTAGLNVTQLGGEAELTLPADDGDTLELWRHNGTAWSVAAEANDTTIIDGIFETTIDEDGLYALVEPPAEQVPLVVNATVANDAVWVENPTDESVTATVADDLGQVASASVAPGENVSIGPLDPGSYTLSAETDAGETTQIDGQEQLEVEIPPDVESLAVVVDDEGPTVENPNDVGVGVRVSNDTGEVASVSVAPGETTPIDDDLASGNYTLSATTDDDRRVPIDGDWNETVEIAAPVTLESVGVAVEVDAVSLDNPNDETVAVSLTNGSATVEATVPGGSDATVPLEPGEYTVTAVTDTGDESVPVDGEDELTITVAGVPAEDTETPTAEPAGENETDAAPDEPAETETETPSTEPLDPEDTDPPVNESPTQDEIETPEAEPNETDEPEAEPNETDGPEAEPNETDGPEGAPDEPNETATPEPDELSDAGQAIADETTGPDETDTPTPATTSLPMVRVD